MGIVFGRFRKKQTTLQKLEKIDKDIKSIEQFRLTTEQALARTVKYFSFLSGGFYVIFLLICFIYYVPKTFFDRILYLASLLLIPAIIVLVRRVLTWFYKRKINRNVSQLTNLRMEKKKLLDEVMDTETYKVAKNILEKFAPDQLRKSPGPLEVTPYKSTIISQPSNLRLRTTMPSSTLSSTILKTPAPITTSTRALIAPNQNTPAFGSRNGQNVLSFSRQTGVSPKLPMPREILPRDRSVLDKMVEYIVGDGPSNRYALICKNCNSHNGMALREEFEYVAYRCCYCYCFNPARKLRPSAPKLDFDMPKTPERRRLSKTSSSESEKNSDSLSESELENTEGKNSAQEKIIKKEESPIKESLVTESPVTESPVKESPEKKIFQEEKMEH